MNRIAAWLLIMIAGLVPLTVGLPAVTAGSEVFAPPKPDEVRARVLAWLDDQHVTDDQKKQVSAIWTGLDDAVGADRLLDLVIQSIAMVDTDVTTLVRECNAPPVGLVAPRADILSQSTRSPFFIANVGLFYGRYLVERRLFDEAWDILKTVDARQVVDPASLFFFQAVAAQGMLQLKPALEAVDRLLTSTERVPVRYSAAAALMQADLKAFQEKSLGEIARLMADSERRLELGRAGEKVQGIQERIISNLDEIIKKAEQQSGGGGGGGGGGNDGSRNQDPGNAADDSRIKGSEAPGETDKKRFDNKGSWGNLPEKELTKAKNDLNKNFPSNYEQAIEKYTKKLASRAAKKSK